MTNFSLLRKVYSRLRIYPGFGDLLDALFSFVRPMDERSDLQRIADFWGKDYPLLVTYSVRTAFDLLLQAWRFPPGSEVLMSAINVPDMERVVSRHNLSVIPFDVSPDTLAPDISSLRQRISDKSQAVVVAHIGGAVNDLTALATLCRKRGLLLVEDCAQAFAGHRYRGHPLADASLFSFGAVKFQSALGGACAFIRDQSTLARIAALEGDYPRHPEARFLMRLLKFLVLKVVLLPPIYAKILKAMRLCGKGDLDSVLRDRSRLRPRLEVDILPEIRLRPSKRMIRMLRRQLESCDEKWYERRSERAVALLQRIRGHLPTPGAAVPGNTFWAFFVRANDPMALKRLLAKDGFITEANPLIVVGVAHEHESRETQLSYVPNARLLSEYTVDIPFRETFTDRELDALAHGIREAAASFPSLSPYESEVSSRPASDAL